MSQNDIELSHGMHVVHDGPRQAPPLLLIHGSGASGGFWGPVVPALADHHHVIRVDLPGHGKSPPARSYDVPAQAARVAAVLDDLGLEGQRRSRSGEAVPFPGPDALGREVSAVPFPGAGGPLGERLTAGPLGERLTVVAHSSGGYIATSLAEQRPDLVRSLALISTGPSLDAFLPQPVLLRVLLAPPFGPLVWSRRSDAMTRRAIGMLAARPVDLPDDLVAEVRGITYRTFRTVLRRNAAYITERTLPSGSPPSTSRCW